MYEAFATVYDRLTDDVDYPAWAALYAGRLGLAPGAAIAECACGTGNMTVELVRSGYRLTGLDSSSHMLAQAMEKVRRLGYQIPFVHQDMRCFALHRPVDAVLATNDGINYLLTEGDLAAFFDAAALALRPGGRLGFDFSSRHKLMDTMAGQFYGEDRGDLCYLWQNRQISAEVLELELTFFVEEADGRFARFEEHQRQRAWSPRRVEALLERCGFTDIQILGRLGENPPPTDTTRYHIFATKGGGK